MTVARRRFEVVPLDWGQSHLTPEAVVAFVDGELTPAAHARASRHLSGCPECSGDVDAHARARSALRSAHGPTLSSSLLSSLHAIPRDAVLPEPPAGLAVGADGTIVQVLRPGVAPSTRRRLGAGLAVSGLAAGTVVLAVALLPADPPEAAAPPVDAWLGVAPAISGAGGGPAVERVLQRLDAQPPVCSPRHR